MNYLQKRVYLIAQVIIPLSLGALIYLFYRDAIVFHSFNDKFSRYISIQPPAWVLFNLPDFLWLYSLLAALRLAVTKAPKLTMIIWIFSGFLLAIVSELLQLFSLIFGTFDVCDLLFYLFALLLFVIFNKNEFYETP